MAQNRRNTYKEDEYLEEPFNIRHLLRASSYIKRYAGKMSGALILSALGGIMALFAPMITQRMLDDAVPAGDLKMLAKLAALLILSYAFSILFITIRSKIMVNVSQDIIYDIPETTAQN